MSDRELSRFRGAQLGFVFQAFHLLDHLSVLENVILGSEPKRPGGIDFAGADRALQCLALAMYHEAGFEGSGGRLAVVTFHSLEDRIVKRFFQLRSGSEGQGSEVLAVSELDRPSATPIQPWVWRQRLMIWLAR